MQVDASIDVRDQVQPENRAVSTLTGLRSWPSSTPLVPTLVDSFHTAPVSPRVCGQGGLCIGFDVAGRAAARAAHEKALQDACLRQRAAWAVEARSHGVSEIDLAGSRDACSSSGTQQCVFDASLPVTNRIEDNRVKSLLLFRQRMQSLEEDIERSRREFSSQLGPAASINLYMVRMVHILVLQISCAHTGRAFLLCILRSIPAGVRAIRVQPIRCIETRPSEVDSAYCTQASFKGHRFSCRCHARSWVGSSVRVFTTLM